MQIVTVSKADLGDLKAVATQALVESLAPLIQGAAADLQQYAHQIVDISLEAGAAGDQETLDSLADTRKVLLEAQRLRAAAGFEHTVDAVTTALINVGIKLLVGVALPGAGPVLGATLAAVQAAAAPAAPAAPPDALPLGAGPTEA